MSSAFPHDHVGTELSDFPPFIELPRTPDPSVSSSSAFLGAWMNIDSDPVAKHRARKSQDGEVYCLMRPIQLPSIHQHEMTRRTTTTARPQELQVLQVLQYLCLKTFWKLFKLDLGHDIKELCSSGLLAQAHPSSFCIFEFSGSDVQDLRWSWLAGCSNGLSVVLLCLISGGTKGCKLGRWFPEACPIVHMYQNFHRRFGVRLSLRMH
ncbi:hypothetical protein C8R45DRAFT_1078628 [Mycena sanguinolenta]|nr:hypothetical protein C8R45DRAFT_1078628 [Mycena sanguinolenta]